MLDTRWSFFSIYMVHGSLFLAHTRYMVRYGYSLRSRRVFPQTTLNRIFKIVPVHIVLVLVLNLISILIDLDLFDLYISVSVSFAFP